MELVERHEKIFYKKNKFNFLEKKCTGYTIENEEDDMQEYVYVSRHMMRRSSKMIMTLELNNIYHKELRLLGEAVDKREIINSLSLKFDERPVTAINCTVINVTDTYFMTPELVAVKITIRCDSIKIF